MHILVVVKITKMLYISELLEKLKYPALSEMFFVFK